MTEHDREVLALVAWNAYRRSPPHTLGPLSLAAALMWTEWPAWLAAADAIIAAAGKETTRVDVPGIERAARDKGMADAIALALLVPAPQQGSANMRHAIVESIRSRIAASEPPEPREHVHAFNGRSVDFTAECLLTERCACGARRSLTERPAGTFEWSGWHVPREPARELVAIYPPEPPKPCKHERCETIGGAYPYTIRQTRCIDCGFVRDLGWTSGWRVRSE